MLRCYRRFWAPLAAVIVSTPFASLPLLRADPELIQRTEMRAPAPWPQVPGAYSDWITLPRKIDDFLADHFGLRREMIRAHSVIAHGWLHGRTRRALVGIDGWFFLRDDEMIAQSAGLVMRKARIAETADVIARMRDALESRGTRFVFASPPNSATIYPDKLPEWARNQGRETEYDLMLEALVARGVQAVDLRPALREARAEGDIYYHYNSHWTHRGALIGFNALTAAIGHPEWRIDPSTALSAPTEAVGDLSRMLGLSMDVFEQSRMLTLPPGREQLFTPQPYATYRSVSNVSRGPTIMIIGDSFTNLFDRMVLRNTSQVAWTHHWRCTFDWKWVDQLHPDEVWFMPAERLMLCEPGRQPAGLPAVQRVTSSMSRLN